MDVHLEPSPAGSLFLLLILVAAAPGAGWTQPSFAGARAAALGGSPAAVVGNLWADANPAGWSDLEGPALGVHATQLYGIEELRAGAVRGGVTVRNTAIVLGARTFGFEDFRQTMLTLGVGRPVRWGTHRPFHLGIRMRYHRTSVAGYGSSGVVSLSAGVVLPVIPLLDVGLAAENLVVPPAPLAEELPRRLHAGIAIRAVQRLSLVADLSKDVRLPASTHIGAEIRMLDALILRVGYSHVPARFSGGLGVRAGPLIIDLAVERHFVLGWTPSCAVLVRW